MTDKEKNFEERVNSAIREMHKLGYKPNAFLNMRIDFSTVRVIKKLLRNDDASSGFTKLWELQRLDLSMENIIQEQEWHELFSDEDRALAKQRLEKYGYNKKTDR